MSWDFNASNNNKTEFTKFPVGVTKIRILSEAPHLRWVHWLTQHRRTVNCPSNDCPICEIRNKQRKNEEPYTYNSSRRLTMNIFNYDTGHIEVMEQGVTFFEDLRDLKNDLEEEGNTLQDAIIKVRRRGSGKDDTSYRLDIEELTNEPIPENLTNLKEFFKPHTPEQIERLINGESWEEVFPPLNNNEEQEVIEVQ